MAVRVHKNFVSLGKAVSDYGDTIEERANKAKIMVAEEVTFNVIRDTPVDTGRARSNWIAKRNSPPTHTRLPFAPGHRLGLAEKANLAGSHEAAKAVFAQAKPGEPLYLKNNLKYIARLNDGYSKQAPANFVGSAITVALSHLRTFKILEK